MSITFHEFRLEKTFANKDIKFNITSIQNTCPKRLLSFGKIPFTEMKSTGRLLYIDGLRAITAVYVVMHHAMLEVYESHLQPLNFKEKILSISLHFGHYAVGFFIILSGFCLMLPVLNNNYKIKGGIGYFLKRRVFRILPPYYFAMIISLILISTCIGRPTGSHWDVSIPVTNRDIITHILMIHDVFVDTVSKISHPFWSIAVEFRIYILFPFILFLWRKFGVFTSLLGSILICVIIIVFLGYFSKIYPNLSFSTGVCPYIILFLLGAIAAKLSLSPGKFSSVLKKTPWLLICLVLFMILIRTDRFTTESVYALHLQDIGTGLCAFCLLLACINSYLISKILSWEPLVFLGSFSYSLYLMHAPILAILQQYLIRPMELSDYVSTILLSTIGTSICIGISYLFFLLFEKPFINMGKKTTPREVEINTIINPAP